MAAAPLRSEPTTAVGRGGFDAAPHAARIPDLRAAIPVWCFSIPAPARRSRAQVIDGIAEFYRTDYANVHRGVYRLSAALDRPVRGGAREGAGASSTPPTDREIVFVRGATEAINLVAQSWGPASLKAGDEIVISDVEHHSNIVPWQMLRDRLGAEAGRRADRRHRRVRPGALRGAAVAAHPARRGDACLERDRRDRCRSSASSRWRMRTAPRC